MYPQLDANSAVRVVWTVTSLYPSCKTVNGCLRAIKQLVRCGICGGQNDVSKGKFDCVHATKTQSGSTGKVPLILNFDTWQRWVVRFTHRLLYHLGKYSWCPFNKRPHGRQPGWTLWIREEKTVCHCRQLKPRDSRIGTDFSPSPLLSACQFLVYQSTIFSNLSSENGQGLLGLQVHRNLYIKEMDVLQSTRTMTDAGTRYRV